MKATTKVWLTLASLALLTMEARATYSLVAADSNTNQVGGVVTSCVSGSSVARVYRSVPGVGAIHAQARSNVNGRDFGARIMSARPDLPAQTVIDNIVTSSFDSLASQRQYGVAKLDGSAAGFTGSRNGFFAADRQGLADGISYSVQGNILTGIDVLSQSESAFTNTQCSLPFKLFAAVLAGAENGQGDSRCRPRSPSDAVFLQVDAADGDALVSIDIRGSRQPLSELNRQFNRWARINGQNCPDLGIVGN